MRDYVHEWTEQDVVLMPFLVTFGDDVYLSNRSGFSRIRPRILHSVVGSLFAKRRDEPTDTGD